MTSMDDEYAKGVSEDQEEKCNSIMVISEMNDEDLISNTFKDPNNDSDTSVEVIKAQINDGRESADTLLDNMSLLSCESSFR